MGKWTGYNCQLGFYLIVYDGDNSSTHLIRGDGNSQIYELELPYDHQLVRIGYAKANANSHAIQIDYGMKLFDMDTYYEQLFLDATNTARTITVELGSEYEGLAKSKIKLTATITNGEDVAFHVLVKFFGATTDMIEQILNHWLIQFVIVAIILIIPTVILGKKFIVGRYDFFVEKTRHSNDKVDEMNTITGKLGFLLKHPDLAFEQLHKQDRECDGMIKEFGNNEQMRKVWENKKKTIKWQLDAATKIMQNRQWIDFIGADTIIPMIGGVEKKIKGYAKNFTKGFGI